MNEKEILKKIWAKELSLKENLLEMPEPKNLWDELIGLLNTLPQDSIHFLRYKKIMGGRIRTWWTASRGQGTGCPTGDPWKEKFEPLLNIFEQYQSEKTLKTRMESENLFMESRVQGEDGDQHLLVGERDGVGNKAHIVIDGRTGEIRVEDKGHLAPEEVLNKIETILTLKDGRKIRTTREVIEEL